MAHKGGKAKGQGTAGAKRDPKRVFVVYGRNQGAFDAMVSFLRALDLKAWDFFELAAKVGGSAFVGDIVRRGMEEAQAVIVLFTPDEFASLASGHRKPNDGGRDVQRWQSRPNVLFEAGLAMGLDEARTILVTLGSDVSLFSDVDGRHVVRMDNSVRARDYLRRKLLGVGCAVADGPGWHDPTTAGDFETCVSRAQSLPRDPFGPKQAPVPKRGPRGPAWSGGVEKNGRRLSATVRPTSDAGWFEIRLEVRATGTRPLVGPVHFKLYGDFPDPEPEVAVSNGVAVWEGQSWGAFRVAATMDPGKTRLYMDLARLPGVPARFAA
jgi:hypothetical protein